MALKPVNFQNIFSHKTSADKKSADVALHTESNASIKNASLQKIGIHELFNKSTSTSLDGKNLSFSRDAIALPGLQQRIVNMLHAFSIQPSPLAQQAVLLAISEGLRLSPSLIRRIMHVLETEPHRDALTLIRALDEEDTDIFFKAIELLTKIRSSNEQAYQHGQNNQRQHDEGQDEGYNEGQSPSANHTTIAESEEKHAIVSQFKALFNEFLGLIEHGKKREEHTSTDASKANSDYGSNFTWIHIPFSFIEGSLNLTGYLRMVYNYYTKKIERIVLECVDEQAERLAVIEAGKALFWSSNKKECISAEQQGLTCVLQKEAIQACALCGINTGIGADNEKKQ